MRPLLVFVLNLGTRRLQRHFLGNIWLVGPDLAVKWPLSLNLYNILSALVVVADHVMLAHGIQVLLAADYNLTGDVQYKSHTRLSRHQDSLQGFNHDRGDGWHLEQQGLRNQQADQKWRSVGLNQSDVAADQENERAFEEMVASSETKVVLLEIVKVKFNKRQAYFGFVKALLGHFKDEHPHSFVLHIGLNSLHQTLVLS